MGAPLRIVPPRIALDPRVRARLASLGLLTGSLWLLGGFLWLLGGVGGASLAGERPELATSLDRAVASKALRGAQIGALVIARDDGRVLYERDPDRALVPASNQKILTALAALATFGPTHRFTTAIFSDAPPDDEGAVGWLAVRGGGDPALTSEDLWRLAADLRRLGLRRVRGGLLLDDSRFDDERWHPSWGPISARAYHAPVGALSVNYGAFAAVVEPGSRKGDPVRVRIDPPVSFLRVSNRASTGPSNGGRTLVVDRSGTEAALLVTVSGVAPAGAESKAYHRSVLDPARYAGSVLRMQMEANGIRVEGETRLSAVPASALPLLEFEGKSVAEIARLFMKFSNNAIAESLVKAMGAHASGGMGSWESGIPAMRAQLDAIGLDTGSLELSDGSGLSYENRVTPRSLVEALRLAGSSFRFGPEFVAALPIAGGDGTLEERAESAAHRVRAKTGLLTRVTALSGYAELSDGTRAVFSIVANGYRGGAERAMAALDAFVAALVSAGVQELRPSSLSSS